MKISELLRSEFIALDLAADSKEDALEKMIQLARGHPNLGDFSIFHREVHARESSGTTSVGFGVAIPHARTEQVTDMLLVVGRLEKGIMFTPTDELPVRLIFLIGTPKKMVTDYLRLVGTLARQLRSDTLRGRLLAATTTDGIIQAFVESEKEPS